MGLLEDELRGTFAAKVAQPPALEHLADRAIGGASRVRARRRAFALTAVVAVAMIGAGTAFLNRSGHQPASVPLAASPWTIGESGALELPIAVLDGQQIITPDGAVIRLELPPVSRAWRVSDGWIAQTTKPGASSLWLVPPAGGSAALLVTGNAVVLSSDGRQVAWAVPGQLHVAVRSGATLTGQVATTGTGDMMPIAFAGDGVLLATGASAAGGVDDLHATRYDMWFPQKGHYRPGPSYQHVLYAVTATAASGGPALIYGEPDDSHHCLAGLAPHGFGTAWSVCGLSLAGAIAGTVAPAGRYLALRFPDRVEVYGAISAPPVQVLRAQVSAVAWRDPATLVAAVGGELVVMSVGTGAISAPVMVPGASTIQPVPTLS